MTRISVESMNALQNITITPTVATRILRATDQLYQTKSKFHRKQQSYGPETNLLQGCPVTLNVATGLLQPKHLVMTIICTKQYFDQTTNNKVMARKRMRTHGRTTRRLICSPEIVDVYKKRFVHKTCRSGVIGPQTMFIRRS